MGKKRSQVLETGVFASPATGSDSPYELLSDKSGQLTVKCLSTGNEFDTSVLAAPTRAQIDDQRNAFRREIAAWLCSNGPQNPERESLAIYEVAQALASEYSPAELHADRQWIQSNDLSLRIKLLREGLPEAERLDLVEFAARIASPGAGISETDAQFIEALGKGLTLDPETVTNTVVQAITQARAA